MSCADCMHHLSIKHFAFSVCGIVALTSVASTMASTGAQRSEEKGGQEKTGDATKPGEAPHKKLQILQDSQSFALGDKAIPFPYYMCIFILH